MQWSIVVLVGTQLLFTASDFLARIHMPRQGFVAATFLSGWFFSYVLLRIVAMFGQLYVLSTIELGKAMALFAVASIMLANVLGFFLLREVLSPVAYIGVAIAIIAFFVLAFS
jgi:drug/metabolite transporter (DMT)-like permease